MSLILAVELCTVDFAEIFLLFFQAFALCFHIPIILKILLAKSLVLIVFLNLCYSYICSWHVASYVNWLGHLPTLCAVTVIGFCYLATFIIVIQKGTKPAIVDSTIKV